MIAANYLFVSRPNQLVLMMTKGKLGMVAVPQDVELLLYPSIVIDCWLLQTLTSG